MLDLLADDEIPTAVSGMFVRLRETAHDKNPDMAAHFISVADRIVCDLASAATAVGIVIDFPVWRTPDRRIVGASSRTAQRHITWLVADIQDAAEPLGLSITTRHRLLACIRNAIGQAPTVCSPQIADIVAPRMPDDLTDEFADIRKGLTA